MKKNSKILLIAILVIAGSLFIFAAKSQAAEFVLSIDFSNSFNSNIDTSQSNFVLSNGSLSAPDNFISARIVSSPVLYTSYNIGSAKLEVANSFPSGGQIVYFLSNDNGATWATAQVGNFVNFSSFGKILRWSAVIARQSTNSPSPTIRSIKITARESDSALSQNNDSQRISDLSTVSNAISAFYEDYGTYPHVDGSDAKTRWTGLMNILSRNKNGGREPYPYLYSTVNDPLAGSNGYSYDYKDVSPNDYVLAATLEIPTNPVLNNDIDGNFGSINCDDPVYCIGVLRNYNYNSGSGGSVLGASITFGTNSTATTVTTFTGTSGLNLNGMIANPLNNLLGRQVFRFGDYNETTILSQTNTTAMRTTQSQNNTSNKTLAQLPLSGSNGKVAGASISKAAGVPTGTSDSLIISMALSGLVTLFYAAYTRTNLFRKRDALAVIKKINSDKNRFNFI